MRGTIKKNGDFRRLYARGKCTSDGYLALYTMKNRNGKGRVGFTVSVKLGHAVVRNRIRRRLREIYRLNKHRLKENADIIVVARRKCVDAEYKNMEKSFLIACEKLGLLLEKEPE